MSKKNEKEAKNNYLFHYNPYKKTFNAFKREDIQGYFNGDKEVLDKVLSSKKISHLMIKIGNNI